LSFKVYFFFSLFANNSKNTNQVKMLFSAGILSLLVASVAAQTSGFDPITAPTEDQVATAGSTLDIVWESTVSEAVTITLLQGATQATLQLGDVIAQSI